MVSVDHLAGAQLTSIYMRTKGVFRILLPSGLHQYYVHLPFYFFFNFNNHLKETLLGLSSIDCRK